MAVFATFVASLAHTLGGGAPPGPLAWAVALAFSVPLAMAVTGTRARLMRTAVAALVAQLALHLTYAMGNPAPLRSVTHAGHEHAGVSLPATPVALDHGNAWMPVAHLVAAAVTVAALVLGDRVLDAFGGAVRVLVRRLTVIPTPVVAPSLRVPVEATHQSIVAALLTSGLGSRGPPVEAAAA